MAIAAIVTVVVARGWPQVREHTDEEHLIPPRSPLSATVTVGSLVCLYLVVVEGSATLLAGVSTLRGVVAVVGLVVLLALWITVVEVRRRVRTLRQELLENSIPGTRVYAGVVTTTGRLAQIAGVPQANVCVTDTDRPESVTVGTGEEAVLLVSTGLLEALPDEELEAVLAPRSRTSRTVTVA